MPEFLKLVPPQPALLLLLEHLKALNEFENLSTDQASGRVLGQGILAPYALPSFPRTTVDGYAVQAKDTHGANESLPIYLEMIGEVPMGAAPDFELGNGQAALIHTGGMIPRGADGVVMVEYTQLARENEVELLRSVAVGENILKVGEDVTEGSEVISAGSRLRPGEIGGLMALGFTQVKVSKRPRVGIISSGDEVIPPDQEIHIGQVRDVNSYTLAALVEQAGGEAVPLGIVSDTYEAMHTEVSQAIDTCDLVIITAGSSASTRDLTAQIVDDLGAPGVLVHGVNVRPGKPTILGICKGKPVIGLPGNPVSALVIAGLFVPPVLDRLMGVERESIASRISAKLRINLSSQAGREDWVAVSLKEEGGEWVAEPVFGKSNLIFTLVRADGLVRIPPDANGLALGENVEVWLF